MKLSTPATLLAVLASVTLAACGGGEQETVSLSTDGLEYEQRIDQAGKCMATGGGLVAITDVDYVDCDDGDCITDRTSVQERVAGRWAETSFVLEPDPGQVHILTTNGQTLMIGRLDIRGTALIRFMERRGSKWESVAEIIEPGLFAGAFDGDRAVLARALRGAEAGVEQPVGTIHIFERDAGTWVEVATAHTEDTTERGSSSFGADGAIAMHGHRVAVADPGTGKVHLFDRIALQQKEAAVLEAPLADGSRFGSALALYEDRLAVGSAGLPGGVFIFTREAREVWTPTALVRASNSAEFEERDDWQVRGFGAAVALHEDYLLVGAPHESSVAEGINDYAPASDPGVFGSGALYLFERLDDRDARGPGSGVIWQERYYIKLPHAQNHFDAFGQAVAFDGERIWAGDESSLHVWRLLE